jgi:Domain of unknown function (DUF4288)
MKTNWQSVAEIVGTLSSDGIETYCTRNSLEALEEILGEEFIHHAVDTFINGDKGNELAIKTIRLLRSRTAAEYAYKIFQQNKDTNIEKARLAIWAMDDILHPSCMVYALEFLGDPRYLMQASWLIKELIYNTPGNFSTTELHDVLVKLENAATGSERNEMITLVNQLKEFLWQGRHFTMPKFYALAINKIAVTNTKPAFEYEEVIIAIDAVTKAEAEVMFERYTSEQHKDYKNEAGEMVTIRFHKLVEINSFLFDVPFNGFAEIYCRHFNDYDAYCRFDVLLGGDG